MKTLSAHESWQRRIYHRARAEHALHLRQVDELHLVAIGWRLGVSAPRAAVMISNARLTAELPPEPEPERDTMSQEELREVETPSTYGDGSAVVGTIVDRPRVHPIQVRLRGDDVHLLMRAAIKRRVSPNRLVRALVITVLRDDLIDAVLDDDKVQVSPAREQRKIA